MNYLQNKLANTRVLKKIQIKELRMFIEYVANWKEMSAIALEEEEPKVGQMRLEPRIQTVNELEGFQRRDQLAKQAAMR